VHPHSVLTREVSKTPFKIGVYRPVYQHFPIVVVTVLILIKQVEDALRSVDNHRNFHVAATIWAEVTAFVYL
jgi:hypothetical protein